MITKIQFDNSQLIDMISDLDEKQFRELMIILLQKAGMANVEETHGTTEFGKDIIFHNIDSLGRQFWTACVVKTGDIKQTGNIFEDVIRQIRECFIVDYNTLNAGAVQISNVIVITNGVFKPNVKTIINQRHSDFKSNIEYWDIHKILDLVKANNSEHYLLQSHNIYLSKYNEYLHRKLSIHDNLKFLESDFEIKVNDLEDFEINIRARSKKHEHEKKAYLTDPKFKGESFQRILPNIEALLETKNNLIVQGIATSGKTTTLKRMGKLFLRKNPNAYVFFIELHKYFRDKTDNLKNVIFREYELNTGSVIDETDFKESKVLILLDGLDELGDDGMKDFVFDQIDLLNKEFSQNRIVIATRESEYLNKNQIVQDKFEIYSLMPLNAKEMAEIGTKVISSGSKTENFVKLIKKSEIMKSFPKTPLTTILLAILFKENKIDIKELPKNVTELYSKFTDIFLDKWDKSKGVSEQYKVKQKVFVLENIAKYMQVNNLVSLKHEDLKDFLIKLKLKYPIEELIEPDKYITSICNRSSIFMRFSDNTYRFFHLTIQEYLAASILDKSDENLLLTNFLDDWWLNANIFYTGKTPHKSDIIPRLAKLELFPSGLEDKLIFVIHSSKVLQSAHLLDNDERKHLLKTMLYLFDESLKELIKEVSVDANIRNRNKTILDMILWARNFTEEFFSSTQFTDRLREIWEEEIAIKNQYTDITEYCISYILSIHEQAPDYLYGFAMKKDTNPRWFRIIDVDVDIFKLRIKTDQKKLLLKIRSKSHRYHEYITKQFNERIAKHLNSITGM